MARLNRVPGKFIGIEKIPIATVLNGSASLLTFSGLSMLRNKRHAMENVNLLEFLIFQTSISVYQLYLNNLKKLLLFSLSICLHLQNINTPFENKELFSRFSEKWSVFYFIT